MRIQKLTWDRVTVTYPEKLGNEVIYFKAASVQMDSSGGVSAITIVETSGRRDALNHTYANPRVFELTPWGFKAEEVKSQRHRSRFLWVLGVFFVVYLLFAVFGNLVK